MGAERDDTVAGAQAGGDLRALLRQPRHGDGLRCDGLRVGVVAPDGRAAALVEQGRFRADLYYRLNVIEIVVPPLRERIEDLGDLARHFFAEVQKEGLPRKTLSQGALDVMRRYAWPGNVRELENLVRRLSALYPQDEITAELVEHELANEMAKSSSVDGENGKAIDLSASVERYLADYFNSFGDDLPPPGLHGRILREVEYPLIAAALAATRGNQVKAADLLGVNRNTLRKKIRDLDVMVVRSIR